MARDPLSTGYENYASRVQERLYAEYRTRLDEERRLRQQARRDVIDVQARRVDVENATARAARAVGEGAATREALAESTDDVRLAQSRRRTIANPEDELANPPFMYERTADSFQVALRTSPLPRGMFIDLTV
ncbi:hypothetical protein JW916_01230 [Candidatus Sumerlaeota bacterium]|nr:hypothetical protein [Candidatus Sumerlaeota bacterium]